MSVSQTEDNPAMSHNPVDLLPEQGTSVAVQSAEHGKQTENTENRLETGSPRSFLSKTLGAVRNMVSPVWPLQNYVAVNPFMGFADRPFLSARSFLRSFSDAEMLMPLDYYRDEFEAGRLTVEDISAAYTEIREFSGRVTVALDSIIDCLRHESQQSDTINHERVLRTVSEFADRVGKSQWTTAIREEIGRHCSAYYDEGQASWKSPWQQTSLFLAWKAALQYDCRFQLYGLKGLKEIASRLPDCPQHAIEVLLVQLNVPEDLWQSFLMCQSATIPGWSAWARYRSSEDQHEDTDQCDFIGLLAIRLAYDLTVAVGSRLKIEWDGIVRTCRIARRSRHAACDSDTQSRYILLRAQEKRFERQLLNSLRLTPLKSETPDRYRLSDAELHHEKRPLAQMVFCIDVRSERYRRCLEQASSAVQTVGFAGFFGVPMAWQPLVSHAASPQVPALLRPSLTVHETVCSESPDKVQKVTAGEQVRHALRKAWKQFQSAGSGCFTFVESAGIGFGWKLVAKNHVRKSSAKRTGSRDQSQKLVVDFHRLEQEGFDLEKQIDLAESILKGTGLTDAFGHLVIFCGHAATSANNPLQSTLDCGACCGHSGEPNARFAATLMNQSAVRTGLAQRGIVIPDDTSFLAALHDTTTDTIHFPDTDHLSESQQMQLQELMAAAEQATQQCRLERMPALNAKDTASLLKRGMDWSEVRPEWGLAGNGAFVAGPRGMTLGAQLDGRVFLHNYDFRTDPEFRLLEQILTAPLIVAHWINMQYYASTVDNKRFGSGTKTIHNVVGRFGIYSGNGGDLTTGLAMQSVHDGQQFQHQPVRLLAIIAAPRDAILETVHRNETLGDLIANDWMHLIAAERGQTFRLLPDLSWREIQCGQDVMNEVSLQGAW